MITELAIVALENEVKYFILHSIKFTRDVFERPEDKMLKGAIQKNNHQNNLMEHYEYLKTFAWGNTWLFYQASK